MIDNNEFNFKKLRVNKFVPLVYDDSMSVYEWLNKFVKRVTDYVNGIATDIAGKLDVTTYNADKEHFETTYNKVGAIFESASSGWYPTVKAVIDYVRETALTKSESIVTDSESATNDTVFSSQYVNTNFYDINGVYPNFATSNKTIEGAIAELKTMIANPNVFVATYGVTPLADIVEAYNDERTILCVKSESLALYTAKDIYKLSRVLINEAGIAGFIFTDAFGAGLNTTQVNNGGWEYFENSYISNCVDNWEDGESVDLAPYNADTVYNKVGEVETVITQQGDRLDTVDATITLINDTLENVVNKLTVKMNTAVIERQVTFTGGEATVTGIDVSGITTGNTFAGSVVVNGLATGNCFACSILDATANSATIYIKCVTENLNESANVRLTFSSL